MAGTPEGAKKAKLTRLALDPDYFKKIGSEGGKARVPKGAAMADKEDLRARGRKLAKHNRRKKRVLK